jgi:GNAT superfamily N-acetyltransferase
LSSQAEYPIHEVTTRDEMRAFVCYPYRLYRESPYYVPPIRAEELKTLDPGTNPAFHHCRARYWIARSKHGVVGRIAGILNTSYNERWKCRRMRFGWFDFEDDPQLAMELLRRVEEWAAEEGMEAVHGPMGFTNFDPAGMLVEGYDQLPTLAELYNHPYYMHHIEAAGYRKEVDWVEFRIPVPDEVPAKVQQIARIVRTRSRLTVVVPQSQKEIRPYGTKIFHLINEAYSHLHGMVPLSHQQIDYYIRKYLPFMRRDYVALVIDEKGDLVAFGLTMPSLSRALQQARGSLFPWGLFAILTGLRTSREGELCLVAVRPDYQGKGVNALLMEAIHHAYLRKKIRVAESNPELEENTRVQAIWSYYGARQHKRRRCYIKFLPHGNTVNRG